MYHHHTAQTISEEIVSQQYHFAVKPLLKVRELRVVLCEDADPVRARLAGMIGQIPRIRIAGEARDAQSSVKLIQKTRPEVAILDIKLPDGSGIDVLRRVKRDNPDLMVIMLTNHANALYRRACANAGAAYFFDKSAEFEKVSRVLADLATQDGDD